MDKNLEAKKHRTERYWPKSEGFGRSCTEDTKKASWWKVEHVKAHRSKKEIQQMSHFENFVTEGNEKADEPVKEGAMLDGGGMAEIRARNN